MTIEYDEQNHVSLRFSWWLVAFIALGLAAPYGFLSSAPSRYYLLLLFAIASAGACKTRHVLAGRMLAFLAGAFFQAFCFSTRLLTK